MMAHEEWYVSQYIIRQLPYVSAHKDAGECGVDKMLVYTYGIVPFGVISDKV